MSFTLGPRRSAYFEISGTQRPVDPPFDPGELRQFEELDLTYRSLCALLYNYVPTSGHPGGSISSGRLVAALLFGGMDYDCSRPDRDDADVLSYAAGHKAMGLYALWALRDEMLRISAPELLPEGVKLRLRLEDLLGFRRNPAVSTPLFSKLGSKPLDGHPTPATPFVRLATGASGVGLASSIGLALGARDYYGENAPRVHVVEGEGGLTPGRVAEALAAASAASLDNLVVHVDWNQSSIDSDRVCRDGDTPGDYVQWTPIELFRLHDWNVVSVADGKDFQQVVDAQRLARTLDNRQPTAIVYRTVKGWLYGIEGRASHGAGHKLCSDGFYRALAGLTGQLQIGLPTCEAGNQRCIKQAGGEEIREECLWEALLIVRETLERKRPIVDSLAARLVAARERLNWHGRRPRANAPHVETVYEIARTTLGAAPDTLRLKPGSVTTLRGELGRAFEHYNSLSGGTLFAAAADLLGSTSIGTTGTGFPDGYWNAQARPGARLLSTGGICEDAMAGILSGLSSFGRHIGVGSSYAAFLAPLGHIAARLHAIGGQARHAIRHDPFKPMVLVCAHAGLKTGEDGPTHADPQPLQLLQENFPRGTAVTLVPWEPQEIWPLLAAAFARRPAVIVPFVTRPSEAVLDRAALGLAPPEAAITGVYALRRPTAEPEGTLVLQESAATYAFVQEALPRLDKEGVRLLVYYVASAELFDLLPASEQQRILPEERAQEAMGITGFTLATLYRWVRSDLGRAASLHPYRSGHFLGSGAGERVLAEAGLDGDSQYRAIRGYLDTRARAGRKTATAREPIALATAST